MFCTGGKNISGFCQPPPREIVAVKPFFSVACSGPVFRFRGGLLNGTKPVHRHQTLNTQVAYGTSSHPVGAACTRGQSPPTMGLAFISGARMRLRIEHDHEGKLCNALVIGIRLLFMVVLALGQVLSTCVASSSCFARRFCFLC